MDGPTREMPRYECRKQVRALKIKEVLDDKASTPTLVFEDVGYAPISVDWDWYFKHEPRPGGYYVVYTDGYKSYWPAKVFEDVYTRI